MPETVDEKEREQLWAVLNLRPSDVMGINNTYEAGNILAGFACGYLDERYGIRTLGQLVVAHPGHLREVFDLRKMPVKKIATVLEEISEREGVDLRLGMLPHELHGWFEAKGIPAQQSLREIQPNTLKWLAWLGFHAR